jgi:hypothetical protein
MLGDVPWWRLFHGQREVDASKHQILDAVLRVADALYLLPPEDPTGTTIEPLLMRVEPAVWAVPNPFKASAAELRAFMDRTRIRLFIGSFHDDTAWKVGVAAV